MPQYPITPLYKKGKKSVLVSINKLTILSIKNASAFILFTYLNTSAYVLFLDFMNDVDIYKGKSCTMQVFFVSLLGACHLLNTYLNSLNIYMSVGNISFLPSIPQKPDLVSVLYAAVKETQTRLVQNCRMMISKLNFRK